VTEVYSTGEERSSVHTEPQESERLLCEVGFSGLTSWFLPDPVKFAEALQERGVLGRFRQKDLVPTLRALAVGAARRPGCHSPFVSCVKPRSRLCK
jgi:hypothetical protein